MIKSNLWHILATAAVFLIAATTFTGCQRGNDGDVRLLNVSYDPTREFYREFNEAFAEHYKQEKGITVTIDMSHDGSSKQARAVAAGLPADVVTLALAYDIDSISRVSRLIKPDWQQQFPENSTPYTSTIVFLVRKGNPQNILTWDDLVRPGIQVITPNPKTSGAARWSYLAGWGHILQKELGDLDKINDPQYAAETEAAHQAAFEYTKALFQNVPVLDTGARGSTMTFVQREIGDVLLAWENEAILSIQEFGTDKFDIVFPPISILAEPPVAIVDRVVDRRKTREVAEAYLQFLYTKTGQELAAKHHYRPRDAEIAEKYADKFPPLHLFVLDDVFGSWQQAQEKHFVDGGMFDKIYQP